MSSGGRHYGARFAAPEKRLLKRSYGASQGLRANLFPSAHPGRRKHRDCGSVVIEAPAIGRRSRLPKPHTVRGEENRMALSIITNTASQLAADSVAHNQNQLN